MNIIKFSTATIALSFLLSACTTPPPVADIKYALTVAVAGVPNAPVTVTNATTNTQLFSGTLTGSKTFSDLKANDVFSVSGHAVNGYTMPTPQNVTLDANKTLTVTYTAVPVATADRIEITSPTQVEIGQTAVVSAQVKDTAGAVMSGKTIAWTSSQPNVIAVDSRGKLEVKRLSLQPVVITASAEGKSASSNITTYGLELTLGTYNPNAADPAQSLSRLTRGKFRPVSGITSTDIEWSVKAPNGVVATQIPLSSSGSDISGILLFGGSELLGGEYVATLTFNGRTYTGKNTLDATQVISGLQNAKLNIMSPTRYTLTGQVSSEAKFLRVLLANDVDAYTLGYESTASLPLDKNVPTINNGVYAASVNTLSDNPFSTTEVTPMQLNAARIRLGNVTVNF